MTDPSLPDLSGTDPTLDTYRRGVDAECDALFGDAMRARQRARVLRRLTEPRVLAFPGAVPHGEQRPSASGAPARASRRWLGVTAAAALMVGLLTGQMLPMAEMGRSAVPPPGRSQTAPETVGPVTTARPAPAGGGYRAAVALEGADPLLDAIDVAVSQRGPSELRALDDLTFQYDPR
ncbi:MAG: hypothetical protein FJW29_02970 [Acidobacteria bacterium]|nr:hypothetical protein [Acidobacteriota bacterium]